MKKKYAAFDEREMVFQEILIKNPDNNRITGRFYVARFYGSRDCWIDASALADSVREGICSIPGVCRLVQSPEGIFRIVSVDWLFQKCTDSRSRHWLEGISKAFDQDNSKGQVTGKELFRNP